MANDKEIDKWRRGLEEAEAELEEKSRQWDEAQSFFCTSITKLARLADSGDSQLKSEIDSVIRCAKNSDDFEKIKKSITRLTNKLIKSEEQQANHSKYENNHGSEIKQLLDKISNTDIALPELISLKQRVVSISHPSEASTLIDDVASAWEVSVKSSPNTGNDNSSQFCALLISEVLYQLIEKLSLPEDLEERLHRLKRNLEKGITLEKWTPMLEEVADMASFIQVKINTERLDIESFLKQVTGRLNELDGFIQGSRKHREESWLSTQAFGNAVKNEMETLVDSADSTVELDALKKQIQQRLEAIELHFEGYRESEKNRHESADVDVKNLISRLMELEEESKDLKLRVQKERMQAQTDVLTGIPNRLGYEQHIAQEYARWKRFGNPLTLVVWDIDLFKRINDDYGHAAGDKALKTIAKLLSHKIRETDYFARFGGEEFVLIMPGADKNAAKDVADKLREVVAESGFHFKGEPVSITVSAGVSEFISGDTPQQVFERADKGLYKAKELGRNRVEIANQ